MNEPKIRFKGFEGEWEEKKLGDICTNFKYGINAAAKAFDGENKYLRITDIDDKSHGFLHDSLTTPDVDLSLCGEYVMREGDIVVARTGASVGKSYIYHAKDGKVYFAGFLIRMQLNEGVSKDFVYLNTLTSAFSRYISLVSQRSGQPGVNAEELKAYKLRLAPSLPEQRLIASYFTHLDTLIESSRQRVEKLKQVKAASLQAMFPQNGNNVPKIRFKGCEGEWKKVKLGDLCSNKASIFSESNLGVDCGKYPIYGATGYIQNIQKYDMEEPYVAIIKDGSGVGRVQLYPAYSSVLGTMQYLLPKENVDVSFLYSLFETIDFSEYKKGSSIPHIYYKDYARKEVLFPSTLTEQRKIAQYFTHLDTLLTLAHQRYAKLQQVKRASLSQMFV